MAGVTGVGVHPTHRRRGLLRSLMTNMLDDARSRAEPVAGLNASESGIYGRFGFGLASDMVELSIDTRESGFATDAPILELRLIDKDEAMKVLPEIFDRQRLTRAGEPSRSSQTWDAWLADPRGDRNREGGLFHAVCDAGYVSYRTGGPARFMRAERFDVIVEELRGMTAEVEAVLWRFVLDLDLVGRVTAKHRPVDEPLRWRLLDPRQLQTRYVFDQLYIRILDVPAALQARGYRSAGRIVLDVLSPAAEDGFDDAAPGRWVLEAGPDGASCRPARRGEAAELRLDVTALGSLFLGGFRASLLAMGGRIEELRAGSLELADTLFLTQPAPLSATGF
jgi:predicted acetyltransferase